MSSIRKEINGYIELIMEMGLVASPQEIRKAVGDNADRVDEGMNAVWQEFRDGNLPIDEAFALLDAGKSLAAKNIMHRRYAELSGLEPPDVILSVPNPGTIAHFLKSRQRDTAILSFHVIGRDRFGVLLARSPGSESGVQGMPGFGGIYYDLTYIDGVKPEFLACVEKYAESLAAGRPDFDVLRNEFDFISTIIFMLLWKPRPPREVIFIPHKLFNMLPLHAASTEMNGERVYLHDFVESISYASCIQEMAYGGTRMQRPRGKAAEASAPRFLSVQDEMATLPWLTWEKKALDVFRTQLEPQGVGFDFVSRPESLPPDLSKYSWISWSSHAESSSADWGESCLKLGSLKIPATTIIDKWKLSSNPVVVLAACESAVDMSGAFLVDEYCGIDMAFRIAGARAAVASLWPVNDLLAAFTTQTLPAWRLQGGMTPDTGITSLQRYLRTSKWKEFLLREEQLRGLPQSLREKLMDLHEPLWNLPDEAFASEHTWAVFRCHGR